TRGLFCGHLPLLPVREKRGIIHRLPQHGSPIRGVLSRVPQAFAGGPGAVAEAWLLLPGACSSIGRDRCSACSFGGRIGSDGASMTKRLPCSTSCLSRHGDNRFMWRITLHYAANFTGAWRNSF